MRPTISFTLLPLVAAMALLANVNVSAATLCNTTSPEFERLGADYFEIRDVTKTHEESLRSRKRDVDETTLTPSNRLNKSDRLSKRNKRDSHLTDPVVARILDELKNTKSTKNSGEMVLCLHNGSHGATHRAVNKRRNDKDTERLTFELKDLQLTEISNGGKKFSGWADIDKQNTVKKMVIDLPAAYRWEKTNSNEITVRELFHNRNINTDGSHLVEVELRLEKNGSTIEIDRTIYINGHWNESMSWQVKV